MKHCLIFSREKFYFRIVLCLNIPWVKAINDYTIRQLRKHGVIKVCSIEYLTIEIELVLDPNFEVLDRLQNYRIFNDRTIV